VGETFFLREEKVSLTKRVQDGQQQAELKKTLQKFINGPKGAHRRTKAKKTF
jgi:hypothetical protein